MSEQLTLADVRFDGRGLIPAVVQEAGSGEVLMVAWMNAESLRKTLETGDTWFWSRSRQELWHKGETSGHFQKVRAIAIDCDADTLLVQVDQIGAACHTGNKSCFFRAMTGWEKSFAGSLSVLSDLKDEIKDRRVHPTEKSYTAYLLQTGTDKICKKIGEEATETVIAAKNVAAGAPGDPKLREEFLGEAADLLYHLSVLLEDAGATINDVCALLEARTHVKGNKKVVGHQDKTF